MKNKTKLPEIGDIYYFASNTIKSFSDIIVVRNIYVSAGDIGTQLKTIAFMQPMDFEMIIAESNGEKYNKPWKWTYTNNNCGWLETEFRKLVKNKELIRLEIK